MNTILYMSAIARALILPPQSLFLMLLIGLMIWRWLPRIGGAIAISAVALLFALSMPAVANLLVNPLEALVPALASPRAGNADAIVVLAAGRQKNAPEYNGEDIPDYLALGRLRYAAKLYRETQLPILTSGGGTDVEPESLAAGMTRALQDEFGIPVRWTEGRSYNTEENARYTARMLQPAGIRRILLVTDAMHMPRAVVAFARAGFEVVPAPTLFFGFEAIRPYDFLPNVEGLRLSHYAIYEWLGLLWYRILYRSDETKRAPDIIHAAGGSQSLSRT